jgi:hypothetical protein
MAYTSDNNLPEMPTGAVDWPTLINDLVAKIETGRTLKLTAAASLTKGDPIYINSSGKAVKADGNVNKTMAIWQSTSTAADAEGYAQVDGSMTIGSWTAGQWIYCSAAGALTATANGPVIGIARSSTQIVLLIHAGLSQQAHIADAKTDYTTGDLDSEAEIISAINTTNGKINSVLAALEALKLTASS